MSRYILGIVCTLGFASGCADRTAMLSLPNVEMLAETIAPGFSIIVVSVHDDTRGVICYLSYPTDVDLTCSSDP